MAKKATVKKDCINYDKKVCYCRGLTHLLCEETIKCPFYKSEKLYNSDESKKGAEPCMTTV